MVHEFWLSPKTWHVVEPLHSKPDTRVNCAEPSGFFALDEHTQEHWGLTCCFGFAALIDGQPTSKATPAQHSNHLKSVGTGRSNLVFMTVLLMVGSCSEAGRGLPTTRTHSCPHSWRPHHPIALWAAGRDESLPVRPFTEAEVSD